jgi:hypothetical protein
MNKKRLLTIIVATLIVSGCKQTSETHRQIPETNSMLPKPVIVYKTKKNYQNLVPIGLNQEKTQVVHYPHPADLKAGDSFRYPVSLENGYMLDRKGISPSVAFLKLTYAAYSEMRPSPSPAELFDMIEDSDPLTECYDCRIPLQGREDTARLNEIIRGGQLEKLCKKLL